MSKLTAVEWFAQQLGITSGTMLDQAKAMEREQTVDAYKQGQHDSEPIRETDAIQYYNEIYKGGEQ